METSPKRLPQDDIKRLALDFINHLAFATFSKLEPPSTPEQYATLFFEAYDAFYEQVLKGFKEQNGQRSNTWVKKAGGKH